LQGRSNESGAIDVDWIGNILKVITVVLGLASVLKVWRIELGSLFTGGGSSLARLNNSLGAGNQSNTSIVRFDLNFYT
jgi:hypothetical protein